MGMYKQNVLEELLTNTDEDFEYDDFKEINPLSESQRKSENLNMNERSEEKTKPSLEVPPKLELKALPTQLKYAYLGVDNNLDEKSLLDLLRWHRKVLGWT